MTMTELHQITTQDWLLSLWPLWLLCFALFLGFFVRKR